MRSAVTGWKGAYLNIIMFKIHSNYSSRRREIDSKHFLFLLLTLFDLCSPETTFDEIQFSNNTLSSFLHITPQKKKKMPKFIYFFKYTVPYMLHLHNISIESEARLSGWHSLTWRDDLKEVNSCMFSWGAATFQRARPCFPVFLLKQRWQTDGDRQAFIENSGDSRDSQMVDLH